MPTTEEVITRYSANEADYVRGTQHAIGATKKLAKAIDATQKKVAQGGAGATKGHSSWLKGLASKMKLPDFQLPGVDDFANLGKMVLGTMAGVATAAGVAGIAAMRKAGDFDALIKALEAVEGGADKAKAALADLSQLAKLPGIDLTDAIQAYSNLRRSNLSGDFAKQVINEFGNANAMSGGGSAEFSQVMRAVTQIANKPFLQGDELVQLMEAGVPAYQLIKQIFGTTDTEELKKQGIDSRKVLEGLVGVMKKLPHVAGSAKNDFENLGQAIEMAMVSAGGALNTAFLPIINEVTRVIEEMTTGGAIQRTFQDIASILSDLVIGDNSSIEDVLYDMLAETKTIAEGIANLVNNAEGALDMAKYISDAFSGAHMLPKGQAAGTWLPGRRQANLDEAELEKELSRKRREKKEKELAKKKAEDEKTAANPPAQAAKETEAVLLAKQTADNTSRIAQLQEKQLQISQTILGGSGKNDLAPVELGGMKRRGRTTVEGAIRYLVAAVEQQTGGAVMQGMLSRARVTR